MKKIIRIGEQEIDCISNALTPFLYTEIFKKDFMIMIASFLKFKGKKREEYTPEDLAFVSKRTSMFAEICFVYAKQAEETDVSKLVALDRNDFFAWLSTIEKANAFTDSEVINSIIELWIGNIETTTDSKNA